MQPYVARDLNFHSFQIGEERLGHTLSIEHGDGFKTYLEFDWNNSGGSNITHYDDNGSPQYYYFYYYVGQIDNYQSNWSVIDETTGENLGQNYQIFTGFAPTHPTAPGFMALNIIESRSAANRLRLIQENGEQWNVLPQSLSSSFTVYIDQFTPTERSYSISYRYAEAPYTDSNQYRILDTISGDTSDLFSYTGGIIDLSQWYLPKAPVNLRVNASRWFNSLWIVQPNTQETMQKGNLQGSWTYSVGQLTFNSSGFYDVSAQSHPDAPFWIWDATRQEYLLPDSGSTTDFLGAYDGTDSDADNLPDWWERTRGTNWLLADTDADGMTDYDEYVQNGDPHRQDNFGVLGLTVVGSSGP
jgi:hypothetical protein